MKSVILAAWAKAYDDAIRANNGALAAVAYSRYLRTLEA